jgi:hypothetical protein
MERDDLFFFPQANPWAAYDLWTCSGMVGSAKRWAARNDTIVVGLKSPPADLGQCRLRLASAGAGNTRENIATLAKETLPSAGASAVRRVSRVLRYSRQLRSCPHWIADNFSGLKSKNFDLFLPNKIIYLI